MLGDRWHKVATASTISRGIVPYRIARGRRWTESVHWRGLRKRMKLSRIGRVSMALVVSVAMGLGMTACGGGTIGFMWVLGTQFNQIAGFKIDDFSGNLTQIPHSPFSSGGADPVSLVVKPGGRFLYVVNKGGTNTTGVNSLCGAEGSISEFSIGGQ